MQTLTLHRQTRQYSKFLDQIALWKNNVLDLDGVVHDGAAFRGNVEEFGFRTLEGARVFLQAKGLTRIDRHPEDEPAVVETWI
jgi:hypothetical protein